MPDSGHEAAVGEIHRKSLPIRLLEVNFADLLSVRQPHVDGRAGIEVEVSSDPFVCVDGRWTPLGTDVPDDLHFRKERCLEVEKLAPISGYVERAVRCRIGGLGAARRRPYERGYFGQ